MNVRISSTKYWVKLICGDVCVVYRVNWLRAKSRRDRWAEELELLTSEMSWVRLYHSNQTDAWKRRAAIAGENGVNAFYYALKQQNAWELLGSQAENALELMTNPGERAK